MVLCQISQSLQSTSQGRLEPLQATGQEQGTMILNREEGNTLKQILGELMKHYRASAAWDRENPTLSELAGFHLLVERSLRHPQAL